MTSAFRGQTALLGIPNINPSSVYKPQSRLINPGLEVFKITKDGKRSPRTISISKSKRVLSLTYGKKSKLQRLTGGSSNPKKIFVSQIDFISKGSYSPRLQTHARITSSHLDKAIRSKNPTESQKIYAMHTEAEEQSISIAYIQLGELKYLDLVVPDDQLFELLFSALNSLLLDYKRYKSTIHSDARFVEYLYENFLDMDPSSVKVKITDLVEGFSTALKGAVSPSILKQSNLVQLYTSMVQSSVTNDEDSIVSFNVAVNLYRQIRQQQNSSRIEHPIDVIWKIACGCATDNNIPLNLSAQQFLKFMTKVQKESKWTIDYVYDIFERYSHVDNCPMNGDKLHVSKDCIDKNTFEAIIFSDINDVFDPVRGIHGRYDMSQPLNCYYVNTSRRTYLSDDNTAKLELFTDALYRGCRCLEIDVWDGVADGGTVKTSLDREPFVCKESYSTSKLLLSDVLKVIRSFVISNPQTFPIILSMENHCSLPYQARLTYHMNSILNDMLFVPESFDNVLPSPESLQGKIILKARRPSKMIDQIALVPVNDFDETNIDLPPEELNLSQSIGDGENWDGENVDNSFISVDSVRDNLRCESRRAQETALDLSVEASHMSALANDVLSKLGYTLEAFTEMSEEEIKGALRGKMRTASSSPTSVDGLHQKDSSKKQYDQGIEINNFGDVAIMECKERVSEARELYQRKSEVADDAADDLKHSEEEVQKARLQADEADRVNEEAQNHAKKAAAEARQHREHLDTSKKRIEQVAEYLEKCKSAAASTESFSITALTEKKISQARATEAEARAERALNTALLDRQRADRETAKEETFMHEANLLKIACNDASVESSAARERMNDAEDALNSIEDSLSISAVLDANMTPRKKAELADERRVAAQKVKETSAENAAAEMIRRHAQSAYDEALHRAKVQADRAADARKHAEHSALIADRLAENAEDERAAAELRQTANDKAGMSLEQTEQQLRSAEEQYNQAVLASEESERLAKKYVEKAEELTEAALLARMSATERMSHVMAKEEELASKQKVFDAAEEERKCAQDKLIKAQDALATSAELYARAAVEEAEKRTNGIVDDAIAATLNAIRAKIMAEDAENKAADAMKEESEYAAIRREKSSQKRRAEESSLAISPSLTKITLLSSFPLGSWSSALKLPHTELLSVNDSNISIIAQRVQSDRVSLVEFTRNHISRVFPSNERDGVSNINPVVAWSMGCQLVAMNSRICDAELMLNEGRFRENGSCGYVLKNGRLTDPKKFESLPAENARNIRVRVLAGYNLQRHKNSKDAPIHPYVNIAVCDGQTGKISTCQTSVVKGNSLSPVWNEEIPAMFTLNCPSLAMMIFSVWDKKTDSFIASASMPFRAVRQGFRSVPLFNESNQRAGCMAFSSLLVEVKFD